MGTLTQQSTTTETPHVRMLDPHNVLQLDDISFQTIRDAVGRDIFKYIVQFVSDAQSKSSSSFGNLDGLEGEYNYLVQQVDQSNIAQSIKDSLLSKLEKSFLAIKKKLEG
jgi:hypothetical protein